MQKNNPDVKAIVTSGYSKDAAISNYKDYGFYGVLSKPFSMDQVAVLLNEIIG